jgi:diaminopimelate decarboxylase
MALYRCGVFNGLIETLGESIEYPILCEKTGHSDPVVLAGPTCDSMDIMYQNKKYDLPLSLKLVIIYIGYLQVLIQPVIAQSSLMVSHT